MKRVVIDRPGGYRRLRLETCPDPVPGPGEVLVDVAAVGVNYADCVTRMGLYASARHYAPYPMTPGFEVAGTVRALGPETDAPAPGSAVMAVTRFNGYANRLVVPAGQVFRVPDGLSPEQAAGFPVAFLTAWYGLHELGRAAAGDRVLVHSAAGGVGGALVQLGRVTGCRVAGVVGATHKVEAVRQLGAETVIDKSVEPLWSLAKRFAPDGFQLVLDANGAATLAESYRHLAPAGRLVVYGFHGMLPRRGGRPNPVRLAWDYLRTPRFSPFDLTTGNHAVLGFNLSYLFDRGDLLSRGMGQLLGWLADGRISPPSVTCYPFDRVAAAHRDLESGLSIGKLVLTLDPDRQSPERAPADPGS